MATERITEKDVRDFQRRLEEFGNSLPAKEQLLLAQILIYASQMSADVEGHGLFSSVSWPTVRQQLGSILESIILEFGKTNPSFYGGPWPQQI